MLQLVGQESNMWRSISTQGSMSANRLSFSFATWFHLLQPWIREKAKGTRKWKRWIVVQSFHFCSIMTDGWESHFQPVTHTRRDSIGTWWCGDDKGKSFVSAVFIGQQMSVRGPSSSVFFNPEELLSKVKIGGRVCGVSTSPSRGNWWWWPGLNWTDLITHPH